ncbi:MAG: glycoside hydrolase [Treponemataceae bacterium]|nr:glycoside hydrolase [Treponemataceae bacterium]
MILAAACSTASSVGNIKLAYKPKSVAGAPAVFRETWGWVMNGRESELNPGVPITDIGYFAAEVNSYGELEGVPDRKKLRGYAGRVHLVLVCDSRALTHFVLDPQFGIHEKMVAQIASAAEPFDGIQVDYELIPGRDAKNFMLFLKNLGAAAKKDGKLFSVCVPARVKTISDDVFPYADIAQIADRVVIMAYDEHWSTSKPGAIASVAWCEKIVNYAAAVVPNEKLVMGLPFYGRTWADQKTAQGWYFSGMNRIMRENDAGKVKYVNDVPTVSIEMNVNVVGWFEDAYSTVQKLRLYESKGVGAVAFWRIGQEDPEVWNWLSVE